MKWTRGQDGQFSLTTETTPTLDMDMDGFPNDKIPISHSNSPFSQKWKRRKEREGRAELKLNRFFIPFTKNNLISPFSQSLKKNNTREG